MSATTDILDGINAEALAFHQAKARYEEEFRRFKCEVPPLYPKHFWPMADAFRKVVLGTMLSRQERISELAADEFLRLAAIGDSRWSLSETVHFCLSYRHYERMAYDGGDACKFGFDRGDDGYGDLMDAVVILGREFNERLHAGRFYNFSQAVSDACVASVTATDFPLQYCDDPAAKRTALASRLRVMVLFGENYFAMSLEDEAEKWVAVEALQNSRRADDGR